MATEFDDIPTPDSDFPPLMPWRKFADSIGMAEEHGVVRGWLDRGYLPAVTLGKRLMVNMILLRKQLTEGHD
jgi:hypothetical protein